MKLNELRDNPGARQSGKRATASKRQPVRMSKRPLGRRKG